MSELTNVREARDVNALKIINYSINLVLIFKCDFKQLRRINAPSLPLTGVPKIFAPIGKIYSVYTTAAYYGHKTVVL